MDLQKIHRDVNRLVILRMRPKQRKILQSHFQILDKWSTML